jgi:20S proteasome alpha/beta subunit
MTTVIGIKCSDGIVLASDSQFTADKTRSLGGSRIFKVNDSIALGAAGYLDQKEE